MIEISQKEFNAMRDSIDESIDRNVAGLDDMMLKKILLAYNTGKYSYKADIIIELGSLEGDNKDINGDGRISYKEKNYSDYDGDGTISDEEIETFKANKELIEKCKTDSSLYSPFELVQGKDLKQLEMGYLDSISSHIKQFFKTDAEEKAAIKAEREERQEKQNKYYLHAKGVIKFVNEGNKELVYYDADALKELYEEYEDNKDWANRDYAESVWKYISTKAYTDGEKGIKMYAHEIINEEVVDWTFDDDDWFTPEINKQLITNYSKTRSMQDLEYYGLVSKYSTPVEFMINLLDISSSQNFVNSFIDKVTNLTSVTVKVYKTRYANGTEITENIKETTEVMGEAIVSARVVKVDYDGDGLGYQDGDAGIRVRTSLSEESALFGAVETTNIRVYLTNIPKKVQAAEIEIKFAEDSSTRTLYAPGDFAADIKNIFTDSLGTSCDVTYEAWFPRYKTRKNTGTINRVTTTLTTETKLDIAVEEAKTWYATITFDNYVQDSTVWESKNRYGHRQRVYNAKPIMVEKSKSDEVYDRDDSNANTIFNTDKTVASITVSEIAGRVESWYADLTSDNLFYWELGGPLTHGIYEWLDKDRGRSLATEDELLNIRFIYAMEEGLGDYFVKETYTPIKMTCKADKYEIGYLYTTINNKLVQDATPTVVENYDFFLSLLKNNTGTYSRDASYNPSGKDVSYKTIYDTEDKVGKLLESGAEMFFELLNASPYTEGLTNIMKYILYKYTTLDYGVTEFNYYIIPKEEFEWI